MSDIIPFDEKANQLPAALLGGFGDSSIDDLIGSDGGGFPVLSLRGSKFRIKVDGGDAQPLINQETGDPMASIELVIIRAQEGVGRTFYSTNYTEGDAEAPDCSSLEGDVPDPSILKPISPTCSACPNSRYGSAVSESGVQSQACKQHKRVAVTFASNLRNEELGGPMMLRVPRGSINHLKDFAKGMKLKGFMYQQIVARVGFDVDASYPLLTFKAVRVVDQEELMVLSELYHSEEVAVIMGATHDTPAATPEPVTNKAVDCEFEVPPPAPTPAAKKKAAPKKAAPKKAAPKKEEPVAEAAPLDAQLDDVLASLDEMEL